MGLLRGVAVACLSCALMLLPGGAGSASEDRALPNLVPRPPGLVLGRADPDTGLRAIRLQTPMTNVGDAHLELLGLPDEGSWEWSKAYQCVGWATDRTCSEHVEVGRFVWHPEHGHHHFEDFARYELRRLRGGRPDMSKAGLIEGGDKVSFCLMDTNTADTDEPNSYAGWPLYTSCAAGTGVQGISRGWADTYTFSRVDQQIVVDEVPPGIYAVVVTVDPEDLVFETDESDNTVVTKVRLSGNSLSSLCIFDRALKRCTPQT